MVNLGISFVVVKKATASLVARTDDGLACVRVRAGP